MNKKILRFFATILAFSLLFSTLVFAAKDDDGEEKENKRIGHADVGARIWTPNNGVQDVASMSTTFVPTTRYGGLAADTKTSSLNAASTSGKKGALFTGSSSKIKSLGCKQVAFNYTLGLGSGFTNELKSLHNAGLKTTLILTSAIPINEDTLSNNPSPYNHPKFYMIDMTDPEVYELLEKMLDTLGPYVDNYVIGNEISDQEYNYYKPSLVEEYTKAYCDSFKLVYKEIKDRYGDANVFISFDQSWDMPSLRQGGLQYYKYNAKEQLTIIKRELGNDINWGVAAHPYPDPPTSPNFWDDVYAGPVDGAGKEPNKAFVVTMKNIEVMCNFLSTAEMRKADGSPRDILISEIGFSDNEGEDIKAAALMYCWLKIENNPQIIGFLYNDNDNYGYGFGLNGKIEEVFKTMDTGSRANAIELMHANIPETANYGQ